MPEYEDKTINCPDCKKDFTFTVRDQEFYAEKDFTPPKRCKPCRDERKKQREQRQ